MKNLVLFTLGAMAFITSCSSTSKKQADTAENTVVGDSIVESQDDVLQPMFVIAENERTVMLHYWSYFEEPVLNLEENGDFFEDNHKSWAWQEQFRQNTSKYTTLIMEDGKGIFGVKYREEQTINPDGETICPGELHFRPECPNSGAYLDIVDEDIEIEGMNNGVIVSDDFLKSHKLLHMESNHRPWDNDNPLPANIIKQLEEEYQMKASRSYVLSRIDKKYTYGLLQFEGSCDWKEAPDYMYDPNVKQCLAVDVLSDCEKLYVNERIGSYYSENDFGWNVDDGGIYSGRPIIAAFEGDDGSLTLCFHHNAAESFLVGIYATKGERLVEKFSTCYYSIIDEDKPVWKTEVAEMQRMYMEQDPAEHKNVKFTNWSQGYIDYDSEWIWIKDDECSSSAIFLRIDGELRYITEVGQNQKPTRGIKDDINYLRISGSAGGPAWNIEIYAFRNGEIIERFNCLEVAGELESCFLDGVQISIKEGQDYLYGLPDFMEI